jgi:glutamine amidotransferase-like uncharacterized protein
MISFLTPSSFRFDNVLAQERKDLTDITVGIYDYSGSIGSGDLSIAVYNMFNWMNATVDVISLYQLLEDGLSGYDIFVIPGGSVVGYNEDFGERGKEIIRNYVRNGGSYFGICGGSHFGTEAYLNLYPGGYINPAPGVQSSYEMVTMNINKDSLWLDLTNISSSLSTIYINGGCFDEIDIINAIDMHIIAEYSLNNMPGMVAFRFGSGSAFLCSPHPEIEEDNNRDGLSVFDYFDDPESEWDLVLRVSLWLINPLRPALYIVLDIIGITILAVVIVFALFQKYVKKR